MKLINNLTAICGATVLSLSLISCNNKEAAKNSTAPASAWSVEEPRIVTASGREIKYSDVQANSNFTYSIDDQIVFRNSNGATEFKFKMRCERLEIQGNKQYIFEKIVAFQPDIRLIELIPPEMFYTKNGEPFKNTACELAATAKNGTGSVHKFSILNLKMDESSANYLALAYQTRPLNEIEFVDAVSLDDVRVPRNSNDETIELICERFTASSQGDVIRDLSDLHYKAVDFANQMQQSQLCRVLKIQGERVKSVSPFFTLRFFRHEEIMSEADDNARPGLLRGWAFGYATLKKQKIENLGNSPIFIRIPKNVNVIAKVQTRKNLSFDWTPKFSVVAEGLKVISESDKNTTFELQPHSSGLISIFMLGRLDCTQRIATIDVVLKSDLKLAAVDANGADVFWTWDLVTHNFNTYVNPDMSIKYERINIGRIPISEISATHGCIYTPY